MKKLLKGDIVVLPVDKWKVDVFTGQGWDNHSRFQIFKGHLKLIGGSPVTDSEYKQLQELLS